MAYQLNCSLEQLLLLTEGQIAAPHDTNQNIASIASLEQAQQGDVAVVFEEDVDAIFSPLSLTKIRASRASYILASKSLDDPRMIMVGDAVGALHKLVAWTEKKQRVYSQSHEQGHIHETAYVDSQAIIGVHVAIGPHVYVGPHATIGDHVTLHAGVKVLDHCIVGSHTIIHAGTVIGSDGYRYVITKSGARKVPQIGIVRIGRHVEIGANCCIDRAGFDETVIGDGVKIDNLVHIAHNVFVGSHTMIIAQTGIAGGAYIEQACQIGGQVGIKDHVRIGSGAKIVSKATVMKDIPPKAVVAGSPAIPFMQWKKIQVVLTKLPDFMREVTTMMPYIRRTYCTGSLTARIKASLAAFLRLKK